MFVFFLLSALICLKIDSKLHYYCGFRVSVFVRNCSYISHLEVKLFQELFCPFSWCFHGVSNKRAKWYCLIILLNYFENILVSDSVTKAAVNYLSLKLCTMKFAVIILNLFFLTNAADLKFLKLESCTSSNETLIELKVCTLGAKGFNISLDVKRSIKKFFVRILNSLNLTKSSCSFIRLKSQFTWNRSQDTDSCSRVRVWNGAVWCRSQSSQMGWSDTCSINWEKIVRNLFRNVHIMGIIRWLKGSSTAYLRRFIQRAFIACLRNSQIL